jgi:hypothetical protein
MALITPGATDELLAKDHALMHRVVDIDESAIEGSLTIDSSGKITLAYGFAAFPLTPASAPTNDYDVANKKYVDDAITSEDFWDRAGTTLSPNTANDSLDMGSGAITTTGTVTGGTLTDGTLSVTAGTITGASLSADQISAGDLDIGNNSLIVDTTILVVNASGYTDKVGICTATPSVELDIVGQLLVTDASYPSAEFVRTTNTLDSLLPALKVKTSTAGISTDGFGSGIYFHMEDSSSNDYSLGGIGAVRDGADNQGKLVLLSRSGISVNEVMSIDYTGLCTWTQSSNTFMLDYDGGWHQKWSSGTLHLESSTTDYNSTLLLKGNGTGNAYLMVEDGSSTSSRTWLLVTATTVTRDYGTNITEYAINEAGANVDYRVEGDTNPYCLFLDAGNDNITINATAVSAHYDLTLAGS